MEAKRPLTKKENLFYLYKKFLTRKEYVMSKKVTKQIIFIYCVITFSLLGTPIVFSQGQVSDTSDLEKELEQKSEELTQAAKNVTKKKLENIEDFLSKGGWDIDTKGWKIITVSESARERIAEIQTEIKQLFIATAEKFEKKMDEEGKGYSPSGIGLPEGQKEKIRRMSESKNQTNITIGSQAMAIKVLLKVNDDLIALARQEEDREKKKDMYLKQAIFVYELSSITIDMINNLSTHGIEDLRNLYKEQMEEFAEMETEFNKMVEVDNDQQAKDWLGALDVLREQWNTLFSFIGKQEDWIKKLKESKEKFENISKKAVIQIKLLLSGIIAEKIMEQIAAVQAVLDVNNIPLLVLGENETFSLFTMPPSGKDFKDNSIKLKAQ